MKIGLQADNFRVHCNIGTESDKWMGVDILMTSKFLQTFFFITHFPLTPTPTPTEKNLDETSGEYSGVRMLNITPLLQTKLKSFLARTAVRDASDIMYLVEIHTAAIDASKLDQTQVDYFLENAELEGEARKMAQTVLKKPLKR